jgi:prostamide/prostaglandin F2alpha synthase
VFCREHALQLQRDRDKFEEAGVSLVVIGQGEPADGARFVESQGLEGLPLLVDTRRESYKAAGAKKATVNELVGPVVMAKGVLRALRGGQRQGRTVGHPAQLGGVLVVDTDGAVVYAHLSEDASDTPPNEEVLEAARRAASG